MSFPRATLRTHRIIRTIASLVIIASVFVAWRFVNFSAIFDVINAQGYDPSQELAEIIKNLRLTPTGDRIMRGTRADLQDANAFNESCKSHNDTTILLGCYVNGHIFVYNINDHDLRGVREATLAHELLHAAWGRMTNQQKEAIRPSLYKMYEENEDLRKHLKLYESTEFYDELHSIVGAQIESEKMPEDLRTHYAVYFTDQNLIANYYHKYNDNLVKTEKRLEELEQLIESTKTAIEERETKYNLTNEQLSKDIADFNSRVEKGLISYGEYEKQREDLVRRQDAMKTEYAEIQKQLTEYNTYVVEYNQYVVFTEKVYNSMNSRAEKPATN